MAHPFRQRIKGSNRCKIVPQKKSVGTFHSLAVIVPMSSMALGDGESSLDFGCGFALFALKIFCLDPA
jgi:hypothetical protein